VAESSEAVITFRLPEASIQRLSQLAAAAPKLTGSPEPSRHQVARSILLEALECNESMALAQVCIDLRKAEDEFRRELRRLDMRSSAATDTALIMLSAIADCIEMGASPAEMPSCFMAAMQLDKGPAQ
jgi:hypothetical protein